MIWPNGHCGEIDPTVWSYAHPNGAINIFSGYMGCEIRFAHDTLKD